MSSYVFLLATLFRAFSFIAVTSISSLVLLIISSIFSSIEYKLIGHVVACFRCQSFFTIFMIFISLSQVYSISFFLSRLVLPFNTPRSVVLMASSSSPTSFPEDSSQCVSYTLLFVSNSV